MASKWLKKHGYKINENYILKDDGKSAFYSENFSDSGALGKFCNEVKSGKIPKGTILIIEDFSRFSRAKVRLAQQRFLELINNGIRIYIAKDDTEYNEDNYDMINMFVSLSKMTAAREDSERKSNHLTSFWEDARKDAVENKEVSQYPVLLPSTSPVWLKKVKKQNKNQDENQATKRNKEKYFEPIPEYVSVIKRIFDLADTGGEDGLGLGSTIIVRILDSEGVKPFKGERGNTAMTFNDSYVLRLLKDQRLLGYLQPFLNPVDENTGKRKRIPVGKPIPNYFPPIIDKSLFDRVNLKIQKRKVYQGGKVARKFTNLFSKLGKCAYCGSSMTLFTKRGSKAEGGRSVYLQCSEGTKLKKCGNRAVRYFDTFEKSVIKSLIELNLSNLFKSNEGATGNDIKTNRDEFYSVEQEQKLVEERIYNATYLLLDSPDDEYIKEAKLELIRQRKILDSKLEKLNKELIGFKPKTNYQDFKDNLEIVINSYSGDEIATYIKRRAINTYLIDILQYIAIDGVKKQAWILPNIEFSKGAIMSGGYGTLTEEQLIDREPPNVDLEETETDFEKMAMEVDAFMTWGFHIKLELRRFVDRLPTHDEIVEMRVFYPEAPPELVKINKICNAAINRNWEKNKRVRYSIMESKEYDEFKQQAILAKYGIPQPDINDDLDGNNESELYDYSDNENSLPTGKPFKQAILSKQITPSKSRGR